MPKGPLMGDIANELLERLSVAPPWQTAITRAISLSQTDRRARCWVAEFVYSAFPLVKAAGPTRPLPNVGRFALGPAPTIPPELTAIVREALTVEGPVLRAAVFMLVGAAVRSPLVPAQETAPWNATGKLRLVGKALPEGRRQRWAKALPVAPHEAPRPEALAGRRLISNIFIDDHRTATAVERSLAPAVAVDLLLSALTFRVCASMAAEACAVPRRVDSDITAELTGDGDIGPAVPETARAA